MRRGADLRKLNDPLVHVLPKLSQGPYQLTSPIAVPAKEHGKAGDHEMNLLVVKVSTGPRAEAWDAARLERCKVRCTVVIPHAVQE